MKFGTRLTINTVDDEVELDLGKESASMEEVNELVEQAVKRDGREWTSLVIVVCRLKGD